jgi:hypothetical protein
MKTYFRLWFLSVVVPYYWDNTICEVGNETKEKVFIIERYLLSLNYEMKLKKKLSIEQAERLILDVKRWCLRKLVSKSPY